MASISDRIKTESIEMLEYFDGFCKKYDIDYCISFGTELGAVRHKGFIPWDDDVDVDMYYKELKKFAKAWKKHGDKDKFFYSSKRTDKYVCTLFPKLRKNGTTWIDPGCENIPIHWGLPIDIFPVFNAPKSKNWQRIQEKMFGYANRFCMFSWNHVEASWAKKTLYYCLTMTSYNCVILISELSTNTGKVFYPFGYKNRKHIDFDVFFPSKPICFDSLILQGHAKPHEYLEWQYGDYMTPPPEKDRAGHPIGIIDLDHDYSEYTHVKLQ